MSDSETIEQLKTAGLQMYTALTLLNTLHDEETVEHEGETYIVCSHCSALADGYVRYPCPTIEILAMQVTSETSEPAESQEPSA